MKVLYKRIKAPERHQTWFAIAAALALLLLPQDAETQTKFLETAVIEGVIFSDQPETLFAPARELGERLGWRVNWDAEARSLSLNGREVPKNKRRQLPDGRQLVALRALEHWGARIAWKDRYEAAQVIQGERMLWVRNGEKRVAINRDVQQMRAWQGNLLVLDTRVSTGRSSMPTPTGSFPAGPLKTRMLISETYGNAKMPWSVQIQGDYVIHGFRSVPPRAASHGCVRVPLTGENPAKWFYEWVEVGTPIVIQDGWPEQNPLPD